MTKADSRVADIAANSKRRVSVEALRTSIFRRDDDLNSFLRLHLKDRLREGVVIAITSKIVSIAEGQLIAMNSTEKNALVRKEADHYLGEGGYGIELTIKHGLLIPSSGIDESNSESEQYILFPKDPYRSAEKIGRFLRDTFGIRDLGIIITDSHTMPLRRGVTGIALSHWGLRGTRSLVGASDLFGRALKYTSVDVVDSLAAMAVFVMGEADDACPLAIIENANVEFQEDGSAAEIAIPLTEDLYYPLLRSRLKSAARDENTP